MMRPFAFPVGIGLVRKVTGVRQTLLWLRWVYPKIRPFLLFCWPRIKTTFEFLAVHTCKV